MIQNKDAEKILSFIRNVFDVVDDAIKKKDTKHLETLMKIFEQSKLPGVWTIWHENLLNRYGSALYEEEKNEWYRNRGCISTRKFRREFTTMMQTCRKSYGNTQRCICAHSAFSTRRFTASGSPAPAPGSVSACHRGGKISECLQRMPSVRLSPDRLPCRTGSHIFSACQPKAKIPRPAAADLVEGQQMAPIRESLEALWDRADNPSTLQIIGGAATSASRFRCWAMAESR